MKELKATADNKRQWNENFLKYTEFIVGHVNYKGLFFERGADKRVKWVVTGKSAKGIERRSWWDKKCSEHGIQLGAGCYAKIAYIIHPTKLHTCQICGKELRIEYVYPNKRTIEAFKREFNFAIHPYTKDIYQIIDEVVKTNGDIEKVKRIFKIKGTNIPSVDTLKQHVKVNFVDTYSKALSPGVFSNSPDRLDGYHSDGNCCRGQSDKGRHKSNMQRYGQDRRVYENWADGDWKMADRLMSIFRKHDLSADHIGPISLGFCHRPKFHPLTKAENSAKNNRMSLADVKVLLGDEQKEQVVSWHSKFIWDKLKSKVASDKDAVKLSDFMRKNLHHILIVFSMIDEKGFGNFLEEFLNPEYTFFDHRFEGFNPKDGSYKRVVSTKRTGKNQQNNIKRYYRAAFEKLQEYKEIENRKTNIWNHEEVDKELEKLFVLLKAKQNKEAKAQLENVFRVLANIAESNW
ncbi:MAG: restriction endonuclease [Bacteroidetes bacterium]|uniref:hypothetical protein n=1 Tax=Phnomibacter sp. TaxID=2836217 RepID=UPI002FDD2979|nr:restriction endonuclease [Bacteroidota bacterium]